jgi:hypothetical protein
MAPAKQSGADPETTFTLTSLLRAHAAPGPTCYFVAETVVMLALVPTTAAVGMK